jgi:hypothetical protein
MRIQIRSNLFPIFYLRLYHFIKDLEELDLFKQVLFVIFAIKNDRMVVIRMGRLNRLHLLVTVRCLNIVINFTISLIFYVIHN